VELIYTPGILRKKGVNGKLCRDCSSVILRLPDDIRLERTVVLLYIEITIQLKNVGMVDI